LDSQTEEALNGAIQRLSGGKTIIIVAHKEASLKHCHRVVKIGADVTSTVPGTT
jgi:ABC-type transport system involved in cytochrome bd biosynthesis fused ATPase/permease subunit